MRFSHFEFDPERDRLGEGPQSEVYRAIDSRLGRTVAPEDPAAPRRVRPGRQGALRARGQAHQQPGPPQHRDDLRLRPGSGNLLHRDGVPRGAHPRPHPQGPSAGLRGRPAHRAPGHLGPGPGAPTGPDPPRPQAGQHHGPAGRQREAAGLRHLPQHRRVQHHPGRHAGGHGAVHVPRAGPGGRPEPALGRLRPGFGPVPRLPGPAGLPRPFVPRGVHGDPGSHARRSARDPQGLPGAPGGVPDALPAARPRGPLPRRPGGPRGAARGGRGPAHRGRPQGQRHHPGPDVDPADRDRTRGGPPGRRGAQGPVVGARALHRPRGQPGRRGHAGGRIEPDRLLRGARQPGHAGQRGHPALHPRAGVAQRQRDPREPRDPVRAHPAHRQRRVEPAGQAGGLPGALGAAHPVRGGPGRRRGGTARPGPGRDPDLPRPRHPAPRHLAPPDGFHRQLPARQGGRLDLRPGLRRHVRGPGAQVPLLGRRPLVPARGARGGQLRPGPGSLLRRGPHLPGASPSR